MSFFEPDLNMCFLCQEHPVSRPTTAFCISNCSVCEDGMQDGIILITIDLDNSPPMWNHKPIPYPYRTGWIFTVDREKFLNALKEGASREKVSSMGWMFIAESTADKLGIIDMAKEQLRERGETGDWDK